MEDILRGIMEEHRRRKLMELLAPQVNMPNIPLSPEMLAQIQRDDPYLIRSEPDGLASVLQGYQNMWNEQDQLGRTGPETVQPGVPQAWATPYYPDVHPQGFPTVLGQPQTHMREPTVDEILYGLKK